MTFIDYYQKVNECNRAMDETNHEPPCAGSCERVPLLAVEVDLHNEVERWNAHQMSIQGVPRSLQGAVPGISIEILETDVWLDALVELLEVDRKELNLVFKAKLLERITKLREEYEAEQAMEGIVVPKPGLFVPGKDDGFLH